MQRKYHFFYFMLKFSAKYKFDILLLITFIFFFAVIKYYYPRICITWDTNYYIFVSSNLHADIRPIGYPFFLSLLYHIVQSLDFVAEVQFLIYFLSIYCFIVILRTHFGLRGWYFYSLGVLLLIEPTGLYYCFTILSDQLFASLTLLYLTSLVLYIKERKFVILLSHCVLIYFCIELRFIGLFYGFFSAFIILLFVGSRRHKLTGIIFVLTAHFYAYIINVGRNIVQFHVPVFSAFSGWTRANNMLYVLDHIKYDANNIADPETRNLHSFFATYMDTTSFKCEKITTDYMWDARSPLNVIRQKIEDSVYNYHIGDNTITHATSMFILAPAYEKWAGHIQRKFPLEYVKAFMIPNLKGIWEPEDGEMTDYYIKQYMFQSSWDRYHITESQMICRKQIFKDHINSFNAISHKVRWLLFVLGVMVLFMIRKRMDKMLFNCLCTLILFTISFYSVMIYSSWFIYRHTLPVYPLMTTVIFFAFWVLFKKGKPKINSGW